MQMVSSKAVAKVAAVATGLAMAASMLAAPAANAAALTDAQVQSILSLLTSFGADSTTIANVKASLTGGTPVSTGTTSTTASSCSFTMDLTIGATGADVTCLQNALIAAGYSIPAGATGYFGSQTQSAVAAWQKATGVSPAVGYFGSISRAHWNLGGTTSTTGTTGTTGTTVTAGTGTGLKISLSPTSPNGTVLVQGQAIGDLGDYVFANPTSAPINVTSLTFNRTGVSNDSTLTNVYLYNGGTRLTDSAGVSNSAFTFSSNPLFTVPAGGTYTVSVRSDIAGSTSGQQIGVSLVSASTNGTLDSSVSFPINSGYQTISAATLATVNFVTDGSGNATPSSNITVSAQNDYPLWQDTVSVSTNAVKLTSLRFTNLGSADATSVTNLRLYVDGVQVGSALPTMGADRSVTFDLSANPVLLSTSSHVVKVLGNISGSAAQRTIQLSVQRSSDAMFVDSQLGQPVTPTANSASFSADSTGVITVQYANNAGVSVSTDPSSPNENVAVGASNVKWASFDMLASGENVKVQDLYVVANTSVHNGGLDNGKIMVNGVQVGSTKDLNEGTTGTARGSATDFSLGSSLILPAGQTTVVDVYADAKTSTSTNLSNNETVQVSLIAGSSNGQGQSSLTSTNIPASAVSGNQVTVSTSSLTATQYSGYGAQTVIAGTNNAKIGAFTLSTGSTEGVSVNTVSITMSGANAASITNLTLKDDATGTTLGTIITTPSATNSFPVAFDIPASSTKTIDVYANVLSGADSGSIVATVGTGTTGTGDSTGTSASVGTAQGLQTITLGSAGLTVTQGAGDPVSDNVLAGASQVHVGSFSFAASNSSYTVQKLDILVPDGAATSVANVTLQYKDANGATQTSTQALTVSGNNAYATASFTGLTMNVPDNQSADVDVYVGTPTIASGAASGAPINVILDRGVTGTFRAIDSAGTATSTVTASGDVASNGTHYVRKSIPTVAVDTTNYGGTAIKSPLYAFTVSADAAGAIDWSKVSFTVATSSATLTNVYLTDSNGTNLLDNTTSSASTTATAITIDLTKNATQPKYQQVAAGATKTYYLYGTVTGFGSSGDTVNISLTQDSGSTPQANEAATTGSGNFEWSDRSATSHSISTTDWTDGTFIKNFTNTSVSYSK